MSIIFAVSLITILLCTQDEYIFCTISLSTSRLIVCLSFIFSSPSDFTMNKTKSSLSKVLFYFLRFLYSIMNILRRDSKLLTYGFYICRISNIFTKHNFILIPSLQFKYGQTSHTFLFCFVCYNLQAIQI